ncbi:MAG: trigger factor [Lachnospiraceae bacterium]|nr:trigger factor [Lachnospiraceae bacterium]
MRRKNLMTAIMCTFCLAAASVLPMTVMAEETELTTEAPAEEEGTEDTDTETEETELTLERPDYTASDYVTLGEYKGLCVGLDLLKVTEEDIDEDIRSSMQQADMLETLTEGTVQEGDTANIDYEGKLNGDAFDGGTAKGTDLVIGSGMFIPGFEEGLIGVAVGDTVDLTLTFPESYGNQELAGQETVFTVTVNEIKRVPELTDENASVLSDGAYTDAASYRESVRAALEEDKESQKDYIVKNELMRQVTETSRINDYPQEMVDFGVASMEANYKQEAENYNMEYVDFLSVCFGLTEDEFREQAAEYTKQLMQQEMILKAIAETEGIEISDEEYAAGCERYLADEEYETPEELEAAYGETLIRISLLQEKTLDFLAENAVIEEETESEAETADSAAEAPAEAGTEAE